MYAPLYHITLIKVRLSRKRPLGNLNSRVFFQTDAEEGEALLMARGWSACPLKVLLTKLYAQNDKQHITARPLTESYAAASG